MFFCSSYSFVFALHSSKINLFPWARNNVLTLVAYVLAKRNLIGHYQINWLQNHMYQLFSFNTVYCQMVIQNT